MQKQPVDTLSCAANGRLLETLYDDVSVESHASYGKCVLCGKYFSKEAMVLPMGEDEWPIVYVGAYCKECYSKPLSKEENHG